MPKAFVIMPFSQEFDDVYTYLIAYSLKRAGFEVLRADSIESQSNILRDIICGILESDLIVADLTEANPNVYYELGLAHALEKKTILLCQELNDIPFDLRSYRILTYSTYMAAFEESKSKLQTLAQASTEKNEKFGNPMSDFGKEANKPDLLIEKDDNAEPGFLDYMADYEECMEKLELIFTILSEELQKYTFEIEKTTNSINDTASSKQKKAQVKQLTKHQDSFITSLNHKNEQYLDLITTATHSIEQLSTMIDKNNAKESAQLVESISCLEDGAEETRAIILGFLNVVKTTPSIEKNFNRSRKQLEQELSKLISNLDQTLSFASRFKAIFQ